MTIDDIRAACVAAGLPGADVRMEDSGRWAITAPRGDVVMETARRTWVHLAVWGWHIDNRTPNTPADGISSLLALMRERAEAERARLVTRLAEIDRVLGRATGAPMMSLTSTAVMGAGLTGTSAHEVETGTHAARASSARGARSAMGVDPPPDHLPRPWR